MLAYQATPTRTSDDDPRGESGPTPSCWGSDCVPVRGNPLTACPQTCLSAARQLEKLENAIRKSFIGPLSPARTDQNLNLPAIFGFSSARFASLAVTESCNSVKQAESATG